MKRFVYNQKYARLLVSMFGKTSQIDDLAKTINANSGHLRIVLDQWHKEGVITKNRDGRDYKITLTEKGDALATKLGELMDINDRWDEKKSELKKETKKLNTGILGAEFKDCSNKQTNKKKIHEVKKNESNEPKSNTIQNRTATTKDKV